MANESENKILGLNLSTAKKVIEADNKVIISGLSKGKKLPTKLRSELEEAIALEGEELLSTSAKSWSDLAILLGITRRTLLRKRKDPDAPQTCKDVEAWIRFLDRDESDSGIKKLNEARLKILKIEAEDRKHKLDVRKGKYVALADIRETWTAHIQKAKALMISKFENELPPVYTLNPVDNLKLNKTAIEEICSILSDGETCTP